VPSARRPDAASAASRVRVFVDSDDAVTMCGPFSWSALRSFLPAAHDSISDPSVPHKATPADLISRSLLTT
jgi:hypothetical protein